SVLGNLAFEAILSIICLGKARKYDLCLSIMSVFATQHKRISGEISPIAKSPTHSKHKLRRMKLYPPLIAIFLMSFVAKAQDAYHTALQGALQGSYGLPAGNWVLNNTEAANLNSDFWWGDISAGNQAASGQAFSQKIRITANSTGNNPWDAGY